MRSKKYKGVIGLRNLRLAAGMSVDPKIPVEEGAHYRFQVPIRMIGMQMELPVQEPQQTDCAREEDS